MSGTGTLLLRLQRPSTFGDPVVAGVADLSFIGDNRRDVEPEDRHHRVALTLNARPEDGRIDLVPGLWQIDAVLASGEKIQDEQTVIGNQTITVELLADRSPREWLDWQHLSGQVAGHEVHAVRRERQALPAVPKWLDVAPDLPGLAGAGFSPQSLDEFAGRLPFGSTPGPAPMAACSYYRQTDAAAVWRMLIDTLTAEPSFEPPDHPPGLTPIGGEERQVYDIYSDFTVRDSDLQIALDHGDEERAHYWAIVEAPSGASLLSLPMPWYDRDGSSRDVGIVVRHVSDDSSLAEAAVRDPDIAAMLGYLRNNRLTEAAFVAKDYERWLWSKRRNPFAAAAGGYVLLATQLGFEDAPWTGWIRNLNRWFPTMPDGAVLEGYMCLNGPKPLRDFERAAACFQSAFERGIPHYTIGLSWLRSGLRSLAGDFSHLKDAAETVSLASRLAETSQVFSSFRLKRG
jgi:hypothetical protein